MASSGKYKPECLQDRISKNHFRKISNDPMDHSYKCLISEHCKQLNGRNKSNLVSHCRTHKKFFHERYGGEGKALPFQRLEYIQNCTELVSVNSEPFALLNKSGFLKMNKDLLQELKDGKLNDGLSAPNFSAIKEHINYLCEEIVKEVKMEVKDRFVTLMIDGASKYQRSILGIYVQFKVNFKTITRSIGMVNLTAKHTGKYLSDVVLQRLILFGIKTTHILAVTTDNGRNMLTMIEHLNEAFDTGDDYDARDNNNDANANIEICDKEGPNEKNSIEFNFSNEKNYDAILKELVRDMEVDEICQANIFMEDQPNFDSILHDIHEVIASNTLNIQGIRCATHTLHLAVMGALSMNEFESIVILCRAVCKELRKSSNRAVLLQNNIQLKMPRIDVKTRWNSIHNMVNIIY